MGWHWCGLDGQCWAAWFWSPATAAWAQAFFTGIAILASGWFGRKALRDTVEIERQKAHMAHLESVGRFKVAVSSAEGQLRQFIDDCRRDRGEVSGPYLRVVGRHLEKQEGLIRAVLLHPVPGVHMFRDMLAVANALHAVAGFLFEAADGMPNPDLALVTDVFEDLHTYQGKLQKYHLALGQDRDASWEDVHPDDTGFAHGRENQDDE